MNRVLRVPHGRLPLVWLLAVVVAIVAGRQESSMQAPATAIPAEVTQAIAADGVARVIVGVRGSFVPEGNLADQAAVTDQRAAMHVAVDAVMGQAAAAGALVGERFETIPFFTAQVNATALAALAAMPEVFSIGHDALARPLLAESAPLVNAPAAWAAGATGAGWSVAILDTGVERTHSFFGGRVTAEACYSNGGGNGTGTSLCPGGVTSSTAPGSGAACSAAIDGCDHGTHVAGIAAGAGGPGGMNGIAPAANIIAMQIFTRFLDPAACDDLDPCVLTYTSDQVRALERTLLLAGAGNVNRIASVNMSIGGGGPYGSNCDALPSLQAEAAAINNLRSIGIATVIASGNNGFSTGVSAPACISSAIAVGSSSKSDGISPFSNRSATMIDLMAPGGNGFFAGAINSAVIGNTFGRKQGTSMAAPHVAGAWAVLKQAVPTATVSQALAALQNTGQVINDPSSASSYRRINVNGARLALINPGSVPGAPGTPTIGGSGRNVVISWTPPATGVAPFTYTVIARAGAAGPQVATLNAGAALSVSVPGAPLGTYSVSVRAANASGIGPESAPVTFSVPIVPTPPGAPTDLAASVAGNQVTFAWTPPATGTTTGYLLRASLTPSGPAVVTLPLTAPRNNITVAAPAGTYYVRLAATNGGVAGPVSNEVAVVVAPPSAPTLNPATVVGRQVNLSWTAPPSGNPPTSYRVTASLTSGGPTVATLNVGGVSLAVNAPPGTYFVRVRGVNAVGLGALSNEITVVVP